MTSKLTNLLAALALVVSAGLAAEESDPEVLYLLQFVEESGCTFVRNGSEHDSAAAADHLRLKYERGGRYVDNADEFIDRLATESSWTGKDYTVTCQGNTEPSADWLHRALAEYRRQPM